MGYRPTESRIGRRSRAATDETGRRTRPSARTVALARPSVLRQRDDLQELRIVVHVLAEKNRIVRQKEILLDASVAPSPSQDRQKARTGRVQELDRHPTAVRSAVGFLGALRVRESHKRLIPGARLKDADRQLGRRIVAHDKFRYHASVRLGVLIAHSLGVRVATAFRRRRSGRQSGRRDATSGRSRLPLRVLAARTG